MLTQEAVRKLSPTATALYRIVRKDPDEVETRDRGRSIKRLNLYPEQGHLIISIYEPASDTAEDKSVHVCILYPNPTSRDHNYSYSATEIYDPDKIKKRRRLLNSSPVRLYRKKRVEAFNSLFQQALAAAQQSVRV